MTETFALLSFPFWVVVVLLALGAVWAVDRIRTGIGLPALAVFATVTAWYVVDLFYTGVEYFDQTFTPDILEHAWWQVAWFLVVFMVLTPLVHGFLNARYRRQPSSIYRMLRTGVERHAALQHRLRLLLRASLFVWLGLAVIAGFRLRNELPYYVFPFLDHKSDPWGRARVGTGFDSLLSLAGYLQLFVAASFGIIAALAKNRKVRIIALCACAVAWPYYIFDRTRNVILSAVLPGMLTWIFLRMRGSWFKKVAILAGFLFLLNAWFGFVISNRASMTITDALQQKGFSVSGNARVHHDGLDMYEELCWIDILISSGQYQPNWGERYFAEAVAPIPRALWPDKPTIGLDYAVARGQKYTEGATISTGMIGQGVVNFGRIGGPAFAALLMSLWAALLARLDLQGKEITLYGFGLILTFNLGRDITLITLYTFVFGTLVVWSINNFKRRTAKAKRKVRPGIHTLPPRMPLLAPPGVLEAVRKLALPE